MKLSLLYTLAITATLANCQSNSDECADLLKADNPAIDSLTQAGESHAYAGVIGAIVRHRYHFVAIAMVCDAQDVADAVARMPRASCLAAMLDTAFNIISISSSRQSHAAVAHQLLRMAAVCGIAYVI